MKKLVAYVIAVFLVAVGGAASGDSGDVILEGQVVCAKCSLHEEGQSECQNVLVVEEDGQESHYYLTKNSVDEAFGDVCMAKRQVRITGTISEGDGHTWIAASKIVPIEKQG